MNPREEHEEEWQKLAPTIHRCPPYLLACRLSFAQRTNPRSMGNSLMLSVLREMYVMKYR